MMAQALEADPEHHEAYVVGVGQDLPLDDACADLVVFSYSLHHVPHEDIPVALSEAERVLRTGGTLAVLEPIAEGLGHETLKLINDETDVRAAAQAALDNDLPATMIERDEVRYTTSYSYGDLAELEKDMADIDPERQAAFDAVKDEVDELFHANAVEHGGAYWFCQPVIMRLFTKG